MTKKTNAKRTRTSYYVTVSYDGYMSTKRDRLIEQKMGRPSDGGGYGFGMRDLSFSFVSPTAMAEALKRVTKIRRLQIDIRYDSLS